MIIKNSSTLRGEDKGEGEITTLPIAGCWLSVEKKTKTEFLLEFTPDLFRGRNDKIKQRCRQEMLFPSLISQG